MRQTNAIDCYCPNLQIQLVDSHTVKDVTIINKTYRVDWSRQLGIEIWHFIGKLIWQPHDYNDFKSIDYTHRWCWSINILYILTNILQIYKRKIPIDYTALFIFNIIWHITEPYACPTSSQFNYRLLLL